MLVNLLYVIVLLAAFPIGYLLAWLCREELVSGRKWLILLTVLSILSAIPVALLSIFSAKLPVILTLFLIAIISLIAIWKSYDRKFIK